MKNNSHDHVYYDLFDTSYGSMLIASTDKGVCLANFIEENYEKQQSWLEKHFYKDHIFKHKERNIEAYLQLEAYFKGERKYFDLNLHLLGTPFQKQVWHQLQKIQYGECHTYKDVAVQLGDAKKCRAVGGAVGKNPLIIIVPCHRVIGSNGKMTGFSSLGGIELKKKLLKLEKRF